RHGCGRPQLTLDGVAPGVDLRDVLRLDLAGELGVRDRLGGVALVEEGQHHEAEQVGRGHAGQQAPPVDRGTALAVALRVVLGQALGAPGPGRVGLAVRPTTPSVRDGLPTAPGHVDLLLTYPAATTLAEPAGQGRSWLSSSGSGWISWGRCRSVLSRIQVGGCSRACWR